MSPLRKAFVPGTHAVETSAAIRHAAGREKPEGILSAFAGNPTRKSAATRK
ncbi:MAG: hypothetical protein ACRC8J_06800 [Phocaeicola sp.]